MENRRPLNPLFRALRKALLFFAGSAVASQPPPMPYLREQAPAGLKRFHIADSVPEADLLRQVLAGAGFHVEYVPGSGRDAGSRTLYVSETEYAEADEFLKDYLNPSVP